MNNDRADRFALGGLLFLSIGLLLACAATGLSFRSLLIALSGAMSHWLYRRINRFHIKSPADYVPSGEAVPGLAIMTILVSTGFSTTVVLLSGLVCIYLSSGFLAYVRIQKQAGFLAAGTCMNIVFILAVFFSAHHHAAFSPVTAVVVSAGILRHIPLHGMEPAAVIIPLLVFLAMQNSMRHIRLFSLGKDYFRITGYSYMPVSFILFITRGLLLFMIASCGGFLYNVMPAVSSSQGGEISDITRSLVPFSAALLLSVLFGPWTAVIISVLMSYLFLALEIRGKQ